MMPEWCSPTASVSSDTPSPSPPFPATEPADARDLLANAVAESHLFGSGKLVADDDGMAALACLQLAQHELDAVVTAFRNFASVGDSTANDFAIDVFQLSRWELHGLILAMARRIGVPRLLGVSYARILQWTMQVESKYVPTNPYHHWRHAADVALVVYLTLIASGGRDLVTAMEAVTVFIAAICHDMGHPGRNNLYMLHSNDTLAVKYGPDSVLEKYSVDLGQTSLAQFGMLDALEHDEKAQFLDLFRGLILATDMSHHFTLVKDLGDLRQRLVEQDQALDDVDGATADWMLSPTFHDGGGLPSPILEADDAPDDAPVFRDLPAALPSATTLTTPHSTTSAPFLLLPDQPHRHALLACILHAADISNTVRPWPLCKRWADLVLAELFAQGDAERALSLPISPNTDRATCRQARFSLDFSDIIIHPFFALLADAVPGTGGLLDQLAENRSLWEQVRDREDGGTARRAGVPAPIWTKGDAATTADDVVPVSPSESSPVPIAASPSSPSRTPRAPTRRVSVAAGTFTIPEQYFSVIAATTTSSTTSPTSPTTPPPTTASPDPAESDFDAVYMAYISRARSRSGSRPPPGGGGRRASLDPRRRRASVLRNGVGRVGSVATLDEGARSLPPVPAVPSEWKLLPSRPLRNGEPGVVREGFMVVMPEEVGGGGTGGEGEEVAPAGNVP
ncbi:hypothetical protein AMAG_12168 [Allomyces macrogynus ATCC 38327]|uniref:Phosphodiesterase n=1 Tax=Allomyces macrogynus (strain ATCC 38327) TaxID=578462 RepID=A0A0L0SX82_ALLM3|nr:hypothetical protein AMAG_12168 [Allomyces macrogynus ATCC 38327]|eukprot:KNE67091.1 hypothetical protein AMAG_12168 [Allomyces macrogynus ATCC 38327]